MTTSTPAPTALARRPLFWVLVAALPVGLIACLYLSPSLFDPTPEWALGLLLATAQTLLALLIVFLLDTRRSIGLLFGALAFAWGVLVSTPLAMFVNTAWISALTKAGLGTVSAAMVAPIDEELAKAIGALLVLALLLPRRVGPLQGLIIGFLVGAGFEIAENFSYALNAASAAERSHVLSTVIDTFVLRSTEGLLLHALWTGVIAAGIGAAVGASTAKARSVALLTTAGLLLSAMLFHALWDLPQLSTSSAEAAVRGALLYGTIVAVFLVVWFVGWRRDRRARRSGDPLENAHRPRSLSST